MKQYAIIGKYGVGKTTLLHRIETLGYKILSADAFFQICYQKNQPCYNAIKKTFGQDFVTAQEVNRDQLRAMLKKDINKRDLLEKTVYPFLEFEIAKKQYDFVEIPIVYSKNAQFEQYFDQIFELVTTKENRTQNIKNKNVENSASRLNNTLNKASSRTDNVVINATKVENEQDLKFFLKTLK